MAQGKDQAVARLELVERPVQLTDGQGMVKGAGWCWILHVELNEPMLAFRRSERGTNDLATKPGRKGVRITERIETQPGGQQRLLDRIGSCVGRTGDQPRGSERRCQMWRDQLPERVTITGASSHD